MQHVACPAPYHIIAAGLIISLVSSAYAIEPPVIIAHRGASGYVAEHTSEAVTLAHGMGADFIEQDVVLTSDNHPVVLHDTKLGRTTDVAVRFPDRKRLDGFYYAIDLTLAEIKQLRVNERIDPKTKRPVYPKRFPLMASDFRVPTLSEEIRLIQGLNQSTGRNVGLYVEIKQPTWHRDQGKDISRIVLDCLAKHGYVQRNDSVYLQCFNGAETRRIRVELNSKLKLVQLIGNADFEGAELTDWDGMCTQVGLGKLAEYVDGIGPSLERIVSGRRDGGTLKITSLVKDAHAAGLIVHPFTFRADALPKYAETFEELMTIFARDIGVDGVFTDFPDLGVRYRAQLSKKP